MARKVEQCRKCGVELDEFREYTHCFICAPLTDPRPLEYTDPEWQEWNDAIFRNDP